MAAFARKTRRFVDDPQPFGASDNLCHRYFLGFWVHDCQTVATKPTTYLLDGGHGRLGLIAEIVNRSTTVFIDYANTLKENRFPSALSADDCRSSALVNHLLLLLAMVVVLPFWSLSTVVMAIDPVGHFTHHYVCVWAPASF